MKVKFRNWNCDIHKSHYPHNGQIALYLTDESSGEMVTKATVCLDAELPEGHCFIKDWSENEGIAKVLEDVGAIQLTGLKVASGYADALVAECLI